MLNTLPMLECAFYEAAGYLRISGNPALILGQKAFNEFDEAKTLDNRQALDRFLASVEKRAFRMAEIATSSSDQAMDIVQDAMFSLVKITATKMRLTGGHCFTGSCKARSATGIDAMFVVDGNRKGFFNGVGQVVAGTWKITVESRIIRRLSFIYPRHE